jgi:hypothetical protein
MRREFYASYNLIEDVLDLSDLMKLVAVDLERWEGGGRKEK